LAEATALAGDAAHAASILEDKALIDGEVLPHEQSWLTLSRAWVVALGGDLRRGRTLAREAADVAAGQEFAVMEALALHCAVRLGDVGIAAERLGAVAARVDGA